MELKQMKYFKTIVDEGTISKAAVALHMAQPPLSIQLKALENELGTELLIRGRRKVTPTQAGKLFYTRCVQILSLAETAANELKDLNTETLRLGISASNTPIIHQDQIAGFIRSHPKLNVRIKDGSTFEMIQALKVHTLDIAIVRTPFDDTDLNAFYLDKQPMVAIGSQDIIHETMCHMKDYKGIPLIVHRRYRSFIRDYCLNYLQFNPNIHISSDDVRTAIFWAKTLPGVTIIPKSSYTLASEEGLSCIELKDTDLYTGIAFITRKQEELSPVQKEFLQMFISQY